MAAFLERKRTFAWVFLGVLLVGGVYIATLPSRYVATAGLLPHDNTSSSVDSLFSTRSPGALFVSLFLSRGVIDGVVDRSNFMQAHHIASREAARAEVGGMAKIDAASPVIHISVTGRDAQEAARLANAYLDSLEALNDKMAQEAGDRQQRFFAAQMQAERAALADAEARLEQTQLKTGLVSPEAQTQLGLGAIAAVREQATALEVQMASLLQSDTEQNPDVVRLRTQIAQLHAKERSMEGTGGGPVGAAPAAGQLPGNSLDVARAQRDVTSHTTLLTQLVARDEAARLSVGSSQSQFEVVDRATVPETKSWPPRRTFLIVAFAIAILAGLIAVLAELLLRRLLRDPNSRAGLERIRGELGLR